MPYSYAYCAFPVVSHKGNRHHQLKIEYDGDAKIEVGGPFAGVEFHHSACLPQRISFYYPVANEYAILSTDYWRRDTTFVMAAGLRFGNEKKIWLGRESLPLSLTPYRVEFFKEDSTKDIRIVYQFAMTKPVLVISFIIRNKTAFSQSLDFETHLETTLRTYLIVLVEKTGPGQLMIRKQRRFLPTIRRKKPARPLSS